MIRILAISEPMIGSSLAPIKTVWVGFALGPEGSFFRSAHPIRIEIEYLRRLTSAQIKDLPQNRKSCEEVKMLIEEVYRGEIQIEKARYRLVGVYLRCRDSETILKASLADIRDGDEVFPRRDNLIGEIETRESGGTTKGSLVINQGIFSGKYMVQPGRTGGGGEY
jgi:hypothetical protein